MFITALKSKIFVSKWNKYLKIKNLFLNVYYFCTSNSIPKYNFFILDTDGESHTWFGSDRDYTYDELLTRVFEIMREKNPDMVAGKKQKFVMRPPQVVRIGTKKTSFANFTEICKT
jgi:hypothetical protein